MGNIANRLVNLEGSARSNGYGWATTAQEVADREGVVLDGKNVLMTGGTAGIGKEVARVLASVGAHVYLACRDIQKGQRVVEEIKARHPDSKFTLIPLDLSSLKSVRAAANEFLSLNVPLHILVNNAAVALVPYTETVDGLEMHMATNHYAHFLLTNLLLPALKKAQDARIVVVASAGHRSAPIGFEDMSGKGTWYTNVGGARLRAYCRSKTANILFATELGRRLKEQGSNITVNCLHPGTIDTGFERHTDVMFIKVLSAFPINQFHKSIPQGASTTVYTCLSPSLSSVCGCYLSDCNIAQPAAHATDREIAQRLWTLSETVTGVVWA